LQALERGDFSREIQVGSGGELGDAQKSLNALRTTLNRIVGNVDHCVVHLGQSAYQIASISQEIENITRNQQSRSDQVMHSAETINDVSSNVRRIAADTAEKAHATEAQAHKGIGLVQSSLSEMERVGKEVHSTAEKINRLQHEA